MDEMIITMTMAEYLALQSYDDIIKEEETVMDTIIKNMTTVTPEQYAELKSIEVYDKQQVCLFDTKIDDIDNRLVVCEGTACGRYNAMIIGNEEAKLFRITDSGVVENVALRYDTFTRNWLRQIATKGNGSLYVIGEDGATGIVLDI